MKNKRGSVFRENTVYTFSVFILLFEQSKEKKCVSKVEQKNLDFKKH